MNDKDRISVWKKKALDRSATIWKLRKSLAEVKASRDGWKARYRQLAAKQKDLATHRPRGHHFPLSLVWLCLYVYTSCQCSFRCCCRIIEAASLMLGLGCCRRPCAATIRNWVCKHGYYCYKHLPDKLADNKAIAIASKGAPKTLKDQQDKGWALIIDESIAIGQEKLLLVLAVDLKSWTFKRPLGQTDVSVLHIGIASSWKGADIAAVLAPILSSRSVAYCVSDKGNAIINALGITGLPHVYDCSHHWASITEALYGEEADFKELMAAMATLRKKWCLSKYAHLMPPQLRSKARFLNLFPLLDWAANIKLHWEELEGEAKECLAFIHTYADLVGELTLIQEGVKKMGTLLKTEGLSKSTIGKCVRLLDGCRKGRPLLFRNRLLADWKGYRELLEQKQTLLCSSDIIETFFGRYKGKIGPTAARAITESALMMGAWCAPVTEQLVEEALCTVPMKEIYKWKKENTTPSLIKKRKEVFSKNCTKNTS